MFDGPAPPSVSSDAKLAPPPEFTKVQHAHRSRDSGYYIWRIVWTGAFILLRAGAGRGDAANSPQETVESAGHLGASFDWRAGVSRRVHRFDLACVTIVGVGGRLFADVVVRDAHGRGGGDSGGGIVGQWTSGHASSSPVLPARACWSGCLRIVTSVPFIGRPIWAGLAVAVWGMGAIALALYRRLQPSRAQIFRPYPCRR